MILSACEETEEQVFSQVSSAVQEIDRFICDMDRGLIESEKVRSFLMKNYGIEISKLPQTTGKELIGIRNDEMRGGRIKPEDQGDCSRVRE